MSESDESEAEDDSASAWEKSKVAAKHLFSAAIVATLVGMWVYSEVYGPGRGVDNAVLFTYTLLVGLAALYVTVGRRAFSAALKAREKLKN